MFRRSGISSLATVSEDAVVVHPCEQPRCQPWRTAGNEEKLFGAANDKALGDGVVSDPAFAGELAVPQAKLANRSYDLDHLRNNPDPALDFIPKGT
jgi:hypothetical protein